MKYLFDYIKLLADIKKNAHSNIFYSEGSHHWPHIKNFIFDLINEKKKVFFVTSEINDIGLKNLKGKIPCYVIGFGNIRQLFFKNVKCKNFITSLPDLGLNQFRKSKNTRNYIYIFHSMISTHMGYKKKAFDYFDTIMCCGPHHLKEIRKNEKIEKLKKKKLIKYGYKNIEKFKKIKVSNQIVIAPSWGPNSIFESYFNEIESFIQQNENREIILRPHPETKKNRLVFNKIKNLLIKYKNTTINNNICDTDVLSKSLTIITDFSGVAFDFAFSFERPVIFIDLKKKINNLDYKKINIEPLEISVRKKIGVVLNKNRPVEISKTVDTLEKKIPFYKKKIANLKKIIFYKTKGIKKLNIDF